MTGDLQAILPALLFLCTAVPLAALLYRLGFFEACASLITRGRDEVPMLALWGLAALTTAVLNLDTTIVLLTPLYLRLARQADHEGDRDGFVLGVVAVPLLLAAFASSFLPVANLTTIILAERVDLTSVDVLAHLGLPSIAACTVGWFVYRRRHPAVLRGLPTTTPHDAALRVGGAVVAGLLVGFVVGPSFGVDAWVVALVADAILAVRLRVVPLRHLPWLTAAAVAAVSMLVATLPDDLLSSLLGGDGIGSIAGAALAGTVSANTVNNLPATLLAANGVDDASWAMWSYLLAVNVGAVLVPIGAVANLLWWRILRDEGVRVDLRGYLRLVVPIAAPALIAAVGVLALQRAGGGCPPGPNAREVTWGTAPTCRSTARQRRCRRARCRRSALRRRSSRGS